MRWWGSWLAGLGLSCGVGEAWAQAPALVAPRAVAAEEVSYPEGASGDAVVLLELLVGVDGNVQDARIIDGPEPFASRARAAAMRFRYEPAKRGDVAVAARIRVRIAFTAPAPDRAPVPAPASAGPDQPSAALSARADRAKAPPAPDVEDVKVRGARQEVGKISLGSAEVRQVPGAFGDAFRAIELLPGVAPIVSGLPFYFVRGSPPGNVGTFLDGIKVPLLYHIAIGPSVVHPGLIDKVDFFPGPYPARYGRFAGAVVAGETKEHARRFHGEASVRLFDAGALVDTPIGDKIDVLAAGRYSYTAAMLQLFSPETKADYWDYQLRARTKIGKRDALSVFAFGSFDDLSRRDQVLDRMGNGTGEWGPYYPLFRTTFHRVDVRHDRELVGGNLRTAATFGFDQSLTGDRSTFTETSASVFGVRTEWEQRLAPEVRVRAGADAWLQRYWLSAREDGGPPFEAAALFPPRDELMTGARADLVLRPSPRLELIPGVRVDVYNTRIIGAPLPPLAPGAFGPNPAPAPRSSVRVAVEPRLATRTRLFPGVFHLGQVGVASQPPSFLVPLPGLASSRLDTGLQTGFQTSQGLELALPLDFTLTATGFLQTTLGMTDAISTCSEFDSPGDATDACLDQRVRGRTLGLEVMLRRPLTKRLTGFVSYTLSRSTRQTAVRRVFVPGGGTFVVGGKDVTGEFDRTHVLNVAAAYELFWGIRVGARIFFYTGRPFSPQIGPNTWLPEQRLPPFARLDVRVEKRFPLFKTGSFSIVLEWLNATLSKEAISAGPCTIGGGSATVGTTSPPQVQCTWNEAGPVTVPSLGVEASY